MMELIKLLGLSVLILLTESRLSITIPQSLLVRADNLIE